MAAGPARAFGVGCPGLPLCGDYCGAASRGPCRWSFGHASAPCGQRCSWLGSFILIAWWPASSQPTARRRCPRRLRPGPVSRQCMNPRPQHASPRPARRRADGRRGPWRGRSLRRFRPARQPASRTAASGCRWTCRNCNLNLDTSPPGRPDLPCESQRRGPCPCNWTGQSRGCFPSKGHVDDGGAGGPGRRSGGVRRSLGPVPRVVGGKLSCEDQEQT